MTEKNENFPRLSEDAVEVTWDAAIASNLAWDEWKSIEQYLLEGRDHQGAGRQDATEQISEQARDAVYNFKLLSDFAGLVMRMPNSPFELEHTKSEAKDGKNIPSQDDDIPF